MTKPLMRSRFTHALVVGGLLLALTLLLAACSSSGASDLPEYGPAPEFALIDQQGQALSLSDVRGRVVLVDFIYTTCTEVCPLLSSNMRQAQDRLRAEGLLGKDALLLSITVDPQRDTPPVLAAYAERYGADPSGWRFLTGNPERVRLLVNEGFKMGVTPGQPDQPGRDLLHGSRIVLVDRKGQVRAYYPPDGFDVEGAVRAMKRLAKG